MNPLSLIVFDLPQTPGFSPLLRRFASSSDPGTELEEGSCLGSREGCSQVGLCHLQQSAQIPGDVPSPAPFSWSSSSVPGGFPVGCSWLASQPGHCLCSTGRDLTLLPASPSSCPSLTLCPSLLTMENMLTSTS